VRETTQFVGLHNSDLRITRYFLHTRLCGPLESAPPGVLGSI
jgi:hypothetical protein